MLKQNHIATQCHISLYKRNIWISWSNTQQIIKVCVDKKKSCNGLKNVVSQSKTLEHIQGKHGISCNCSFSRFFPLKAVMPPLSAMLMKMCQLFTTVLLFLSCRSFLCSKACYVEHRSSTILFYIVYCMHICRCRRRTSVTSSI